MSPALNTTSPAPTRRRPSPLRRAALAMSLTATLAGGTLVAGASTASAAPSSASVTQSISAAGGHIALAKKKKAKPYVKLTASRKTARQGKSSTRPVFKLKATANGKPLKGKVGIYVNGKRLKAKAFNKNGVVYLKPKLSQYRVGHNSIKFNVVPNKSVGRANLVAYRPVTLKAKKTSGSKVVSVAKKYVGARYVYGGSSPRGFDCSGFTSYVYKKATGKKLPRSSSAQRHVGKKVSRSSARPGDIVYTPGHVAIYAGKGYVIEAGNPRTGVVKRKMWQKNPTFIRV